MEPTNKKKSVMVPPHSDCETVKNNERCLYVLKGNNPQYTPLAKGEYGAQPSTPPIRLYMRGIHFCKEEAGGETKGLAQRGRRETHLNTLGYYFFYFLLYQVHIFLKNTLSGNKKRRM